MVKFVHIPFIMKQSEGLTIIKCWIPKSCQQLICTHRMLILSGKEILLTLNALSAIFWMKCFRLMDFEIWRKGLASKITWIGPLDFFLYILVKDKVHHSSVSSLMQLVRNTMRAIRSIIQVILNRVWKILKFDCLHLLRIVVSIKKTKDIQLNLLYPSTREIQFMVSYFLGMIFIKYSTGT